VQEEEFSLVDDKRFNLPEKFEKSRKGQLRIAEQAADLLSSDTDIVLVEATTGFGKSLFAEMVRQLLKTKMIMVVPRIDLQEQFLNSFPYAQLLLGRSNFPHGGINGESEYPEITCADCNNEYLCQGRGCLYKEAKSNFVNSDLGVTNTSYYLAAANYVGMFRPGVKDPKQPCWHGDFLTAFDECDTMEDSLLNFMKIKLNMKYVRDVISFVNLEHKYEAPKPPVTNFDKWPEWLEETVDILKACREAFGKPGDSNIQDMRWYNRLDKTIKSLQAVQPDWVYDPIRSSGQSGRKTGEAYEVNLEPLTIGDQGYKFLWRHTSKVICTSGTITSQKIFMEETGLDKLDKKIAFLGYQNNWDKRNRSIHRIPGVKVTKSGEGCDRKKRWKEQPFWDELCGNIAWILLRYPNERCMIASGSYELTQDLAEFLELVIPERLIVDRGVRERVLDTDTPEEIEDKMKRNQYLAQYIRTPGSVIISPRLGRGTDLPGSLCRNFILAKTPFADLGNRRIAARVKNTPSGNLYYMVKSVRDCEQNFGRAIREPDDWARIWVVDDCFQQIIDLKGLMSKYVKDAMKLPRDYTSKFKPLTELEI
jgi:hypothetical protein